MKDWKTLQPDQIRLINKHFTPGRGGQKIQHVTIHHMGGIGDTNQCWQWWQTRAVVKQVTSPPENPEPGVLYVIPE